MFLLGRLWNPGPWSRRHLLLLNWYDNVWLHVCDCVFSHSVIVQLFATPWNVDHQAPLCMGFPRQEYWSGLPFPSPEDLSEPGIKSESPALQADSPPSEPPGKPINRKDWSADPQVQHPEIHYVSLRVQFNHITLSRWPWGRTMPQLTCTSRAS